MFWFDGVILFLKQLAFLIADTILAVHRSSRDQTHILVVRTDAIGDYIVWRPFAVALRDIFPKEQYCVTLLGNSAWIEFAKLERVFDQYIEFDVNKFVRSWTYRYRVIKTIRQNQFDICINPTLSRDFFRSDV